MSMFSQAQTIREDDPVADGPSKSNQTEEVFPCEVTLKELGIPTKFAVRHLNFYYGETQALFDNNLDIAENQVTAIIGPSGCGKSTHLRVYNRIYELYRDQRATGEVWLDGV